MSYKFLAKKGPALAFGLFVVCAIISVIPILGGLSDFSAVPTEKQAYVPEGDIFYAGLYLAYILLYAAVIITVILSVWQVVTNPKGSMKALISLGILAVAFLVLYSMADAKGTGSVAKTIETFAIGDGISKLIGGGLQLSVIMLLGSVVVTIGLEIWNFFKNQ